MTTDKTGLDWADAWRAITTDRAHQHEAKLFDELAYLSCQRRRYCLKIGPWEHRHLPVQKCIRRNNHPHCILFVDEEQEGKLTPPFFSVRWQLCSRAMEWFDSPPLYFQSVVY